MDESKDPGLKIAQVYLNVAEFRHHERALELPPATRFEGSINVHIGGLLLNEGKAAAVAVRVFTDPEDDSLLYHLSLEMVGIVEAVPEAENLSPLEFAQKNGAVMLFPFVREAVANLTMRGRFGPVWISPMNLHAALSQAETPRE